MAGAAGAAGAAAAAQLSLEQQEEEEMTRYSPKDLGEDWEFKILRTNTRLFRNPASLRRILEEEKRSGWVLVEKFDDTRIRLKRRAGVKVVEEDFASGYDPYRTQVGPPVPVSALIILIIMVLVFMAMMFFIASR